MVHVNLDTITTCNILVISVGLTWPTSTTQLIKRSFSIPSAKILMSQLAGLTRTQRLHLAQRQQRLFRVARLKRVNQSQRARRESLALHQAKSREARLSRARGLREQFLGQRRLPDRRALAMTQKAQNQERLLVKSRGLLDAVGVTYTARTSLKELLRRARIVTFLEQQDNTVPFSKWGRNWINNMMNPHRTRTERWRMMHFLTWNGLSPSIAAKWTLMNDVRPGNIPISFSPDVQQDYDDNAFRNVQDLIAQSRLPPDNKNSLYHHDFEVFDLSKGFTVYSRSHKKVPRKNRL